MYITRRLSRLLGAPESLAAPPEGPNSGYLVIQDDESEKYSVSDLPFPQNKELTVSYGSHNDAYYVQVFMIPVLNFPLSSKRYYAIVPQGNHIGEAFTCSREDEKVRCCFCRCIKQVKPRPLDPHNAYQQVEIVRSRVHFRGQGAFYANSVASDGFPPYFLRCKDNGWTISPKTATNCKLNVAEGMDSKIRSNLPEFNFSLPRKASKSSTVGRWCCPFMFVKEGTVRDQVKESMYYEITLEQRWEQVFTCHRSSHDNEGNSVAINGLVEKEVAYIDGVKAAWNEMEGFVWFSAGTKDVGLRVETMERMRWEEERFGYISGEESGKEVMVNKVEEYKGEGDWNEFGSYVLAERFNLRRRDGSLVMCYEFKHLDKMKAKWQ